MPDHLIPTQAFLCLRCGHVWLPRGAGTAEGHPPPKVCPKCKSLVWMKARKGKSNG